MLDSKGKYWLLYVAWLGIMITPPLAYAVGPEDAEEWAAKTPISINITAPANNTYVPINHTKSLTATASDTDCYRVGTTWYNYSDDVTSGNSSTDYHVWWTASTGSFTDMYGTSATYQAPGYSAGNNVRDVTITAHADDFNRGSDTYGYNDTAKQKNITLKVWQVTITIQQNGNINANNDSAQSPAYGDPTLGWIIPGTPAAATGYHGNTQVTGSIPEGPGVTTGYQWYQFKKGLKRIKISDGAWQNIYNQATWELDFDTSYGFLDADSRHPNTTGTDVRQIFALDGPGFVAGATNDALIGAPNNLTDWNFDMDYRPKVNLNNILISNEPVYEVIFTLDVQGGKWHVVGDHTP